MAADTESTERERPAPVQRPLGRFTTNTNRWYVQRVHINPDGYDRSGNYWGTGSPLWYAYSADGKYAFTARGTRDYITACYQAVRCSSHPDEMIHHLESTGRLT